MNPIFCFFTSMSHVGRSMFDVRCDSFVICYKPVYPSAFTGSFYLFIFDMNYIFRVNTT